MKGAAAGSGFFGTISSALSGAGTGIANAWTGLTSATSAAFSGNFAQAGQHLGAGIQGNLVASPNMTNLASLSTSGTSNIGLQAPQAATGVNPTLVNQSAPLNTLQAPASALSNVGATAPAAATTAPSAAGGFLSSDLAKYGLITGATQIAGNAIAGYGQQEALKAEQERQERLAAEDRARKEENWQTAFQYEDARGSGFNPNNPSNQPATPSYGTQFAGGPALLQGGLVGNQMYPSTLTNNRFPTFNPAYSRFV